MFAPDDTIVAIATPPGRGALGVIRISGAAALDLISVVATRRAPLEPRRATLIRLRAIDGATAGVADHVVATYFPAPHSYTGQDVVELSAHGSDVVLRSIVRAAIGAGARLARPGEFTLRAFLAGRIDLVQAEAVADLIDAATPLQARAAFDQLDGTLTRRIRTLDAELFDLIARLEASLDFPDEGYHFIGVEEVCVGLHGVAAGLDGLLADARRGRVLREGASVVLVGRTNVGKSSLFNALSGAERAIVTSVPGTTRDLVTERVEISGIPVTLVDTAGARVTVDVVEREGVRRGEEARRVADLVVVVLDGSVPRTVVDADMLKQTAGMRRIVVANKSDLPAGTSDERVMQVSARTGDGLTELRCAIARELTGGESHHDSPALTNLRHIGLLEEARACLARAASALADGAVPEEFLLIDLQAARVRFDEIVGVRTTDDVLTHIFERFCIGK